MGGASGRSDRVAVLIESLQAATGIERGRAKARMRSSHPQRGDYKSDRVPRGLDLHHVEHLPAKGSLPPTRPRLGGWLGKPHISTVPK
jgi:hypothetical protein